MRNTRSGGALRAAESTPPRRERNAAETRQRILHAAELEFAKKGYDGARLGQIARSADVQQALIHHYFDDKQRLYQEVIERALEAMSIEGWDVVHRVAQPLDGTRIPEIVEAFVDLLMRQAIEHGSVYAIIRHASELEDEGRLAGADALIGRVMRERTKPVFDAVVALIETLIEKDYVREDVRPRHLCISALSLVLVTVQDEQMVRALWPVDVRAPEFVRERKAEIVATLLSRMLEPR